MHDAYRLDRQGNPTHERVMESARLLQDEGSTSTSSAPFTRRTPPPAEVYRFLRDEVGAEWIQFIPIVERVNDDGTPCSSRAKR